MSLERRRNRTRYAVLGMLNWGPASGYDLRRTAREMLSHFWHESYGQIYPTLRQLARERLVAVREEPTGGRGRRTYRLTRAGRAELRRWLGDRPEPQTVRNELLLKLVFGAAAGPALCLEHVRAYHAEQRRLLDAYRRYEKEPAELAPDNPHLTYLRLTLRAGVAMVEARCRWCEEAERELGSAAVSQECNAAESPDAADVQPSVKGSGIESGK